MTEDFDQRNALMRILFVFILFSLTVNTQAEIHTWVDNNGKKHFSDSLPDYLKHKTSTVNYSSSIPTAAEREEENRIYDQSKKYADNIASPSLNSNNAEKIESKTEEEKHLTRNDKIKLRQQEEAEAFSAYLAAKRCAINSRTDHISSVIITCGNLKRPRNC
jgi:PhoPQ-activated pathogenicity-related protein